MENTNTNCWSTEGDGKKSAEYNYIPSCYKLNRSKSKALHNARNY